MFIISEFNPQLMSDSDSEDFNNDELHDNINSPNPNSTINTSGSSIITYKGQIKSLHDALILLEATRLHKLPTINRRLSSFERKKFIKPNTIFIWNETSCGMKRWTDGKMWSASKVFNNHFLIYYEKNDKDNDGLIKQSFSLITKDQQRLHLIYYFKKSQLNEMKASAVHIRKRKLYSPLTSDDDDEDEDSEHHHHHLQQDTQPSNVKVPSQDPTLKDLVLSKDVYPQNLLIEIPTNTSSNDIATSSPTTTTASTKGSPLEDLQEQTPPSSAFTTPSFSAQQLRYTTSSNITTSTTTPLVPDHASNTATISKLVSPIPVRDFHSRALPPIGEVSSFRSRYNGGYDVYTLNVLDKCFA
ncbi:gluconate transport-inducing protein [Scheffersomyces coipomensis]|uniref:gluconate transport-inducing protein n=1 Tax=Scheffersomyces coipomensis TaxID=1788519 RepID=UPI00315DB1C8